MVELAIDGLALRALATIAEGANADNREQTQEPDADEFPHRARVAYRAAARNWVRIYPCRTLARPIIGAC